MYKPYDDCGVELDANYSIETVNDGFDLIIESQGGSTGGKPPRNTDYSKALDQHLRRMAKLGMVLDDLQVASKKAMKYPEHERQICPRSYSLPLELSKMSDFKELRLAIGRASAAYKRAKPNGGNPTKKLLLRMSWPESSTLSEQSIAKILAQPVSMEKPTANPKELTERVERARRHMRMRKARAVPPKGQEIVPKIGGTTERYIRDPEVIAWILEEATGNCESCGKPAPFKRTNGEPFLEVHHVRPLGEGGPDTTDNAVACCPNCHRQLHYDADKNKLRLRLISIVRRLRDFPEKV